MYIIYTRRRHGIKIKQVPAEGTVLALFKYANKGSTVYAFQICKIFKKIVISKARGPEWHEGLNGVRTEGNEGLMARGPDRKSTRLNSSHKHRSRMPSSA